jgi:hypothetical protein
VWTLKIGCAWSARDAWLKENAAAKSRLDGEAPRVLLDEKDRRQIKW